MTPSRLTRVVLAIAAAGAFVATPGPGASAAVANAQVRCQIGSARFSFRDWRTDFLRCSVPLSDFRPAGSGRDGIPPIDRPKLESVAEADAWLREREPVMVVELLGDARAYPLQILIWHEIVNDWIGGIPTAVTFSPLCNTALAFVRQTQGLTLDFGTTGLLRRSDQVMWDRQTESWWQQATGEAVVGQLTGTRLEAVPASIVSWAEFRAHQPNGYVLSRDTGQQRDYGRNPYVRYDEASRSPTFFDSTVDPRLRPKERVVTVSNAGETVGYAFAALRQQGVISDSVGGHPIAVFFDPRTISALDQAEIVTSREVGSSGVFSRELDGQTLTFILDGTAIVDAETGSTWTILGYAISGPRAGARLRPIVHLDAFWFATAAFYPDVRVWTP